MQFKIGIDPGLTGALILLEESNKHQYHCVFISEMPVMPLGKNKHQVNSAEVARIMKAYQTHCGHLGYHPIVYLERVTAMPEQGVTSMFNFGMSYGVIQGVVQALNMPLVLVSPGIWKKRAGIIGKDKDYARTIAQQLWPGVPLGLKKDIGKADALLIARFGE